MTIIPYNYILYTFIYTYILMYIYVYIKYIYILFIIKTLMIDQK